MADKLTETVELKPCPFCGGHPVHTSNTAENHLIRCAHCCAKVWGWGTKERAIEAWNTRAALTPAGEAEGVDQKLRDYARAASIGLMRISGGGSEMFTRIGDEFYADPNLCADRAQEKLEQIHRIAALSRPNVDDAYANGDALPPGTIDLRATETDEALAWLDGQQGEGASKAASVIRAMRVAYRNQVVANASRPNVDEPSDELIDRIMQAVCDPGRFVGFKGEDRTLNKWQRDALRVALNGSEQVR